MVMPASSSMADRRATMTLEAARRRDPTARVDVHTISMAMGMEATRITTQLEMEEMRWLGTWVSSGVITGSWVVRYSFSCAGVDVGYRTT
jgi:hypothetical protein